MRPLNMTMAQPWMGHRRGQTRSALCRMALGSHCPSPRFLTHKQVCSYERPTRTVISA